MKYELDDIWLKELDIDDNERLKSRRYYRIKMLGVIGISYLIDFILLFLFAQVGGVEPSVYKVYGLLGLTHVVLFSLLHYTGFSDRFHNPHMTIYQMIFSILIQIICMSMAPHIMPFFLAIIFIIFSFGVLRISLRQALQVWIFTCLAILTFFIIIEPSSVPGHIPKNYYFLFIISSFALILLRTLVLGYYGFKLRSQILKQTQQFEALSETDGLTGVMNRRAIMHSLDINFQLFQRNKLAFCVAMIDVDNFKNVNDIYGHSVGDNVLKQLTILIKDVLRLSDQLGRYGGEEFLLIMPATKIEEAFVLLERIRKTVQEYQWHKIIPELKVTISCGICQTSDLIDEEDLLNNADHALYNAKQNGRNQTQKSIV